LKSAKKELILANETLDILKICGDIKKDYYWLYLGKNYKKLLWLKNNLPKNIVYYDTVTELIDSSNKLKMPFIEFIGKLSVRSHSLSWWIAKAAEKNTLVSPVFLHICYLDIAKNLFKNKLKDKNIIIISDSDALLEIISKDSRMEGYSVRSHPASIKYKEYFWLIFRLAALIKSSIYKMCVLRDIKKSNKVIGKGSPLTVLRTWVGEGNMLENGEFKDQYFNNIGSMIKNHGKEFVVLPIFYGITRSLKEAVSWCRKSNTKFIIPYDYYLLADYIKAILVAARSFLYFKEANDFNGSNIAPILREETRKTTFEYGQLDLVMHYFLVKRLMQKGIKIEKYIITFENMFPAKPIILGVKEFMPSSKIYGYQHTFPFPLLLHLYPAREEVKILPLPDLIICLGKFSKNILADGGYPPDMLVEGPALRFQYLLDYLANPIKPQERTMLLVTLPLMEPNAFELLSKVAEAIKGQKNMKISIKAHPMMKNEILESIIKSTSLDNNYKVVSGTVGSLLPQAKILISIASTTLFEALAYGVPSIRVRSSVNVNLDPLDWFDDNKCPSYVANSPEEIKALIDRLIKMQDGDYEKIANKGRELINLAFSPVNDKTIAAFLN